jgi:hypothetical protein
MTVLRGKGSGPTSESDRPTSRELSRRDFLKLGALGLTAFLTMGSKAFTNEGPEKPIQLASAAVNTGTKAETPGDKQASNLSSYTLSVNSTNVFVGEAVLVSLVDSRGDLAKGSKVEVTDPNGNTFKVSIDNLQNGFIAKVPGDYLVEYGKKRLVVTVREMDAELKALDPVPIAEVERYVNSEYATTFVCKLNRKSNGAFEIGIYDSETGTKLQVGVIDASNLVYYKKLFDGNGITSVALGFEAGIDPKRGEYGIFYIVPRDQDGKLVRGMPFVAKQCIMQDNTCGTWYGRLQ